MHGGGRGEAARGGGVGGRGTRERTWRRLGGEVTLGFHPGVVFPFFFLALLA
jgi:hypothetical protein